MTATIPLRPLLPDNGCFPVRSQQKTRYDQMLERPAPDWFW